MTFLADIPGNLIFFIVMAAVGVVNWILEKRKKSEPPQRNTSAPRNAPLAGGESEQERLRRFLEALGVPQQPGSAQTPQQAPAPRPAPASRPAAVAKPAIQKPVSRPREQSTFRPKPVRVAPRPVPARVAPPEPREMAYAGRLEEPATAVENVPKEFEHMNVAVTMQPIAPLPDTSILSIPATVTQRVAAPIIESLRLALRTPADLRTAVVTMEILGTPRGLQS